MPHEHSEGAGGPDPAAEQARQALADAEAALARASGLLARLREHAGRLTDDAWWAMSDEDRRAFAHRHRDELLRLLQGEPEGPG